MKITIVTPRNTATSNTVTSTAMTNGPISARTSVRTQRILTDTGPRLRGPRTIAVASTSGPNTTNLPLTPIKTSNSPTKLLRPTWRAIWLLQELGSYQLITPKKEWTSHKDLRARTSPPIAQVTTRKPPKARTESILSPTLASTLTPAKTTFRISMNHSDGQIKPLTYGASAPSRIMTRKTKSNYRTVTAENRRGRKNKSKTTILHRLKTAQVNICLLQLPEQ